MIFSCTRHVLFWTARTFGYIFLDGVNVTRNFGRKLLYVGNIRNENSFLSFILLQRIWLDLWFVTDPCKTPIEFPATISVSARPMSFTTMATLRVLIVSMDLGSFTYSTFRSHRSKSFKLFEKKNQDPEKNTGPYGIWTHDLCDTGAALYQLS